MGYLRIREPFDIFRKFNESFFDVDNESAWTPRVNVSEKGSEYEITAELPGIKKEDITLDLKDNRLTIKGEKKAEKKEEKENYLRVERSYGSFERSFYINDDVDVANVNANYKDGILHITLPKKEEAKPKQIKVEVK